MRCIMRLFYLLLHLSGQFGEILAAMARAEARQIEMDRKLNRLLGMELTQLQTEKAMSAGIEQVREELSALNDKVDQFTTDQGELVKQKVAAAIKAYEDSNAEGVKGLLDEIKEIGDKLVTFKPSGN